MVERDKVVVCDNGTGFVKCGFAGDNFPRATFPCMVGTPTLRTDQDLGGEAVKDLVVGAECAELRHQLDVTYPVSNGIINSWEDHSEPEKQKRLSQDSLPEILSNGDETLSGDDGQYMDEDLGGTYLPPHAGEPAEARGMECIYEGLVAGKFEHLYAKVLANGSEFLEKLHASLGQRSVTEHT